MQNPCQLYVQKHIKIAGFNIVSNLRRTLTQMQFGSCSSKKCTELFLVKRDKNNNKINRTESHWHVAPSLGAILHSLTPSSLQRACPRQITPPPQYINGMSTTTKCLSPPPTHRHNNMTHINCYNIDFKSNRKRNHIKMSPLPTNRSPLPLTVEAHTRSTTMPDCGQLRHGDQQRLSTANDPNALDKQRGLATCYCSATCSNKTSVKCFKMSNFCRSNVLFQRKKLSSPNLNAVFLLLLLCFNVATVTAHKCEVLVYFGLKTARCDRLELNTIPQDLSRDIKVLSFANNLLTEIPKDTFVDYMGLQEIYIVHNDLSLIAPDAFKGPRNLQILDLEGNQLTNVPSISFQHIRSVRILSLKDNPISYITENAFANLPNVEEINLENCFLERIDPRAFIGLLKLTDINLVNNELKELSGQMQNYLPPKLNVFRIYRNPWNCDCHLKWLREWISNSKVNWDFAQKTPTCSSPEIIKSIDWKHMSVEQFACPSRILMNSTTTMLLVHGHNTTIECIISGSPIPKVTWLKNGQGIAPDYDKYIVSTIKDDVPYQIRSYLTIRFLTLTDVGDYKCIASNSAGRSEVTYKLWVQENLNDPAPQYDGSMPQESILGIAVGGAVLLLVLAIVVVYGMRRRDKRKHAYKVREGKAMIAAANIPNALDNDEKMMPNATTQLLTNHNEKKLLEKPKDKEKEPMLKADSIIQNDMAVKKENIEMKKFSTQQTDTKNSEKNNSMKPIPIANGKLNGKPIGETTPDLLKNDFDHKEHKNQAINNLNKKPNNIPATNNIPKTIPPKPMPTVEVKKAPPRRDRPVEKKVQRTSSLERQKKEQTNKSDNHPPAPPLEQETSQAKDNLPRQRSLSRDSILSAPRGSPAKTPTRSIPQPPSNHNSRQLPNGGSGRNLPLTNHARGPVNRQGSNDSDRVPPGKYQTLPHNKNHSQYIADGSATLRANHGLSPGVDARPAAQAGVLSQAFQTLPTRGKAASSHNRTIPKPPQPCRVPVVAKSGKIHSIPPPPAPPAGHQMPNTDYRPRPKNPSTTTTSKPKNPTTSNNMYDFPSGSADWTGEKEKMPKPGTLTEFGTAV